ncbi:FtsB family cell division protein [Oerskovia enterophila]|uniref:Septum formation initiator n=1 Tax=Oerskovia enterophila TaxID=43678 RepID=A0ABX2Y7Y1_9CELL|nr:septum formation initiator family protein [Oerskovia enterophila]OCI32698.1 septum formation initiator [Oerskovia enterophila]
MPSNRRPSAPGASARPGGRGAGGSRGDGRSSSGRARSAGSSPTTSRADAGTSGPASGKPGAAGTAKPTKAASPGKSAKSPGTKPAGSASAAAKGSAKSSTKKPPAPGGAAARSGAAKASTTRTPRARGAAGGRAPALADRRRSRYGLLLPEVVTVRALVMSVVVLLAVILLLPTVRAYVNQTGELRALRADVAEAQATRDELEVELGRWDDQAYVIAQARDRLSYVMPGERAWRVVDPDTVVDDLDPETGQVVTDGPVDVAGHAGAPWYTSLWRSVQLAGEQPEPATVDPAGSVQPPPPATDTPTDPATPTG